jgi:general secretion pathway protein A
MFTNHFNMREIPFSERVPVDRIFRDQRILQGLARLQYLQTGGTIALVTGETGVGKSCLLKLFINSLTDNSYKTVYLHITNIRATSLLKLIVSGMGEIPAHTKELLFSQIIDRAHRTDATTILLIDECHLLTSDALVDLRLLVSSALDEQPTLKIILSGQEAIRKQLQRSCHKDLSDRISVKYHLHSLTQAQTYAYIDYQMDRAGSNDKVFEPEVKSMIHEYTNGIPRQINNIAIACLIQAALDNVKKVTTTIFAQAARECQI